MSRLRLANSVKFRPYLVVKFSALFVEPQAVLFTPFDLNKVLMCVKFIHERQVLNYLPFMVKKNNEKNEHKIKI